MNDLRPYRLLSRKEAAEILGIKVITLAKWQSTQRYKIPMVKVGRLAKYRLEDLLDFMAQMTINKSASAPRVH